MSDTPIEYTSVPVKGWVVVQAANLQKADGYVLLDVIVDKHRMEGRRILTEPTKLGEKTWHFSIVNIDGANESLTTSRIGEAIVDYVELISGMKVRKVQFHEHACERLSLSSSYAPD